MKVSVLHVPGLGSRLRVHVLASDSVK
jgi:hypothetical protein